MDQPAVTQLFRRAIETSDAAMMQHAIEMLFQRGPQELSADDEYLVRHDDYVMEMPQSGERIRGRDAMRERQRAFPVPPTITIRRVVGSGHVWVIEGINDYAGDVWNVVAILEFASDGRMLRDTRYYGRPFAPPEHRSSIVERI